MIERIYVTNEHFYEYYRLIESDDTFLLTGVTSYGRRDIIAEFYGVPKNRAIEAVLGRTIYRRKIEKT